MVPPRAGLGAGAMGAGVGERLSAAFSNSSMKDRGSSRPPPRAASSSTSGGGGRPPTSQAAWALAVRLGFRSRCRFRNGGTGYVRESGMEWMRGGA
jgi:hypothetical protein